MPEQDCQRALAVGVGAYRDSDGLAGRGAAAVRADQQGGGERRTILGNRDDSVRFPGKPCDPRVASPHPGFGGQGFGDDLGQFSVFYVPTERVEADFATLKLDRPRREQRSGIVDKAQGSHRRGANLHLGPDPDSFQQVDRVAKQRHRPARRASFQRAEGSRRISGHGKGLGGDEPAEAGSNYADIGKIALGVHLSAHCPYLARMLFSVQLGAVVAEMGGGRT